MGWVRNRVDNDIQKEIDACLPQGCLFSADEFGMTRDSQNFCQSSNIIASQGWNKKLIGSRERLSDVVYDGLESLGRKFRCAVASSSADCLGCKREAFLSSSSSCFISLSIIYRLLF